MSGSEEQRNKIERILRMYYKEEQASIRETVKWLWLVSGALLVAFTASVALLVRHPDYFFVIPLIIGVAFLFICLWVVAGLSILDKHKFIRKIIMKRIDRLVRGEIPNAGLAEMDEEVSALGRRHQRVIICIGAAAFGLGIVLSGISGLFMTGDGEIEKIVDEDTRNLVISIIHVSIATYIAGVSAAIIVAGWRLHSRRKEKYEEYEKKE